LFALRLAARIPLWFDGHIDSAPFAAVQHFAAGQHFQAVAGSAHHFLIDPAGRLAAA
jgi:hypothetical protein